MQHLLLEATWTPCQTCVYDPDLFRSSDHLCLPITGTPPVVLVPAAIHQPACVTLLNKSSVVLTASVCYVGLELKPGGDGVQPARSVKCIRQRSTVPALDVPDVSCTRYDIAADINTIFQEELFTDATVGVEGKLWHVHRAILASASPVLKDFFLWGIHQFLYVHTCLRTCSSIRFLACCCSSVCFLACRENVSHCSICSPFVFCLSLIRMTCHIELSVSI